jgi:UDP-glucose 4-epimerase
MNILITGGLGYIGGRVSTYLKEKDPSSNIFLTTRNIHRKLPLWTDKFTPLQMDVLDESSIANCIKNKDIDVIIHLAALNEIDSMKDPDLALEVNTRGTYRLLYLANINNINKFIYFSTFHVYGETLGGVITEEIPTKPFHPYAISHRAAEDFVAFFKHYHKMDTLILRLSNGFGYPMQKEVNRWTLVFNDFCKQAVTTSRIVLKSSGKQFRDFISLHDIARAVYHFLFVIPDKWSDGLYNLGGDRSLSILEVAQIISDVYQEKYKKKIKEIKIESNSRNLARLKPFKYSIEKIKKTHFRLKSNATREIKKTMSLCEEFLK